MAQPSLDFEQRFYEGQRQLHESKRAQEEERQKRLAAERAQEEERQNRQAAERVQEEERQNRQAAERSQAKAEEKTRKTTLPEFLDACHVHLQSALTVQTDATLSTTGDPANANDKMRPERILAWDDFPTRQEAIWIDLQQSTFMNQRHFTSRHTLEESGEAIRRRMMSSELDLNYFERHTVEDHISSIVEQLYNHPALREKFHLKGSVRFENHANTLRRERQMEDDMQDLGLSGSGKRRSPRLLAQSAKPSEAADLTAVATASTRISIRPRADQFCVYNISSDTQGGPEDHIPALISEFKPPHKLKLGYIYEGLCDMELDEVVCYRKADSLREHSRRLVAAVITQAFSYMVQAGLNYGYVCTGEAFIFLRVPIDPTTVYYYLSVPKGDVGETTGLSPDSGEGNRLHLTAVGQVLAFTLQALKTPLRSHSWRANAFGKLKTWAVVYDDLLDKIPGKDAYSSEYRPPRQKTFLRMSPIQLRSKRVPASSVRCRPPQDESYSSDEDSPDPDTPSRTYRQPMTQLPPLAPGPVGKSFSGQSSRGGGKKVQYCTQNCLRGLAEGGPLDKKCHNARDHGKSHHLIDRPTFLRLIRQQLSKDLDIDCKPVGVHGARGALFMVRLTSHGYTVAAKCTTIDFIAHLKREAIIYERLRPIQGIHVPVYLGNVDLDQPYFYDGIAEIVHMMFIGFGGQPICRHINANNRLYLTQQVKASIQAIHRLGVLHRDAMPRNILWNSELSQAMIIDFERAEIRGLRAVLDVISPNRKRKRANNPKQKKDDLFEREARQAIAELTAFV